MSAALALVSEAEFLVPAASTLAMIQTCAAQIEQAKTIPDLKRAISHAEAIYAVTQKIETAERIKKAALGLLVDAETQLGRLTKLIPQAKRGAGAVPGATTKRMILKQHGINRYRSSIAEKYAATPKAVVEAALSKSRSLNEVSVSLGFKSYPDAGHQKTSRDLDFLTNEAIELLERCVATQGPPPPGNVIEMRNRLARLRVAK